ncbi:MAG: hypothetical protein KAS32_03345 [Candidatus Peribacteraceae bacterium]|nr:hypothetical protein [Candidatus Peribacteraceae bacterium]
METLVECTNCIGDESPSCEHLTENKICKCPKRIICIVCHKTICIGSNGKLCFAPGYNRPDGIYCEECNKKKM